MERMDSVGWRAIYRPHINTLVLNRREHPQRVPKDAPTASPSEDSPVYVHSEVRAKPCCLSLSYGASDGGGPNTGQQMGIPAKSIQVSKQADFRTLFRTLTYRLELLRGPRWTL
jgi:hypothetical protein